MSRKNTPAVAIQRGDKTTGKTKYQRAIERAKQKGDERKKPGDLKDTPRFDQIQEEAARMRAAPGADHPVPTGLSPETAQGLTAAAAATAAMQRTEVAAEEPVDEEVELSLEEIRETFDVNQLDALTIETIAYPERGTDASMVMRLAVEGRCEDISIGQYLMNGVISQVVPIIPPGDQHTGLAVTYHTVSDAIEVYIDKVLSEEASKTRKLREDGASFDVEMSKREYQRRSGEWALAAYIHSYRGNQWPISINPQTGEVNEDAMRQRLKNVRQLPSQIFAVISTNLGWFLERVSTEINTAALGNG